MLHQTEPGRNLVQTICQLAEDRNAQALNQLIKSGISLNVMQDDITALGVLGQGHKIKAALFLINKFNLSRLWFVYGLGLGGHNETAQEQIALAPLYECNKLHEYLLMGLGRGGYVEVGLKQIAKSPVINQPKLQEILLIGLAQYDFEAAKALMPSLPSSLTLRASLVAALGRCKNIKGAEDFILALPSNEHFTLMQNLIYGLGCSSHLQEARDEITKAPSHQHPTLRESLVRGLGYAGNNDTITDFISKAPHTEKDKLEKVVIHCLARCAHLSEVRKRIDASNPEIKQDLRKEVVQGLLINFHFQEAKQVIVEAPQSEQKVLREKFMQTLLLFNDIERTQEVLEPLLLSINDQGIENLITEAAKKDNSSLDTTALIIGTLKIKRFKNEFKLENYEQAKALSVVWKQVLEFYLIGPRQMTQLPIEVFLHIASFTLGLSEHDTVQVYKAIHQRISDRIIDGIFNRRNAETITHTEVFDQMEREKTRYQSRIVLG